MGIFIYMAVSKSVTSDEWKEVYQETLQLVRAFPLAEQREVTVRGVPTICMVPTEEHEYSYGWHKEKVRVGWSADGDYESLRTAERYFMPRELVKEDEYEAEAPDAMLVAVPAHLEGYSWEDERFNHHYSLWGMKTQGEPYHMYLLSIACLIETRLGRKAYVYGDITKGQCERAVRMANSHLDRPIRVPDRCDTTRLLSRIDGLPLTQGEKLKLFVRLYLGRRDADFGLCLRDHFSEQTCYEYWMERLHEYQMSTRGFDDALKEYLQWGFGLEELCSLVSVEDDDGITHYDDFIHKIMDAKMHHPTKDCTDVLEIDPDEERPYGIGTLLAQFALAGARNKKVDRYIPIDEIRDVLLRAFGDACPVNELIDEYLQREESLELSSPSGDATEDSLQKAIESDPSSVLTEAFRSYESSYRKKAEEYDIFRQEDLPYYEEGDTISPNLKESLVKSFGFYQSLLSEDRYSELMERTSQERCEWLAQQNRWILLLDKSWEKIYDDIRDYPESFGRYYPMVRVRVDSEGQQRMIEAFVTNDALYSYVSGLTVGA